MMKRLHIWGESFLERSADDSMAVKALKLLQAFRDRCPEHKNVVCKFQLEIKK